MVSLYRLIGEMCWLLENICRIKRRASWNILFGQRWWENCWFCCLLRFIDWSLPASTLLPFFKSSLRYTTPRERFITHRSTCPRANALLFIMEQMFRGDITLFNLALFLIFHPHIWISNFVLWISLVFFQFFSFWKFRLFHCILVS